MRGTWIHIKIFIRPPFLDRFELCNCEEQRSSSTPLSKAFFCCRVRWLCNSSRKRQYARSSRSSPKYIEPLKRNSCVSRSAQYGNGWFAGIESLGVCKMMFRCSFTREQNIRSCDYFTSSKYRHQFLWTTGQSGNVTFCAKILHTSFSKLPIRIAVTRYRRTVYIVQSI